MAIPKIYEERNLSGTTPVKKLEDANPISDQNTFNEEQSNTPTEGGNNTFSGAENNASKVGNGTDYESNNNADSETEKCSGIKGENNTDSEEINQRNFNKKLAIGIGIGVGATIGTVACIAAAPFVLAGAGFGAAGVAAGSIAAAWQSSIGAVAAGSLFATLQSAGAAGIGAAGLAAAGGVGAAAGVAIGAGAGVAGHKISQSIEDKKYRKSLEDAFNRYDDDKDGFITLEQLNLLLESWKVETCRTTSELMELFSEGQNGKLLRFSQCVKLLLEEETSRDDLKGIFDTFDENKDGFITLEQLSSLLESLQLEIDRTTSDLMTTYAEDKEKQLLSFPQFLKLKLLMEKRRNELREMFKTFDENKDGFITLEQFGSLMQSLPLEIDGTTSDLMATYSENEEKKLIGFPEFLKLLNMKARREPDTHTERKNQGK